MNGTDWNRLANYVAHRLRDLDIPSTRRGLAQATGISEKTIGKLMAGTPVSSDTLVAVEGVLGWTPGSAQEVLSGGVPTLDTGSAQAQILAMTAAQLTETHRMILQVSGQASADAWLRGAMKMRREHAAKGPSSPQQTSREVG